MYTHKISLTNNDKIINLKLFDSLHILAKLYSKLFKIDSKSTYKII